ncbi:MAG: O-antigen ligase family protein [Candidatus Uhrbacteria bacterium]
MTRTTAIKLFKGISLVGIYGGLLVPLMFIPVVIFPFVFSKIIFFQMLIGLTFPAYLALAWMDPQYRPNIKHQLYVAIAAYFVAVAVSVIFAVDPSRAWWGNQERMNGLFSLLHFFAWMTMMVGVLKTWEDWKRLLIYEVALSAIMAIVAMLQRLNPDLLLFKASGRVGGLVDNPIYMAAYQIFNFFFLALLFWKVPSKSARIWFVMFFLCDVVAFILAQSRGAFIGLAAGIFAFALYIALFSKSRKLKAGVFGGVLVLVLGYGGLYLAKDTAFVINSPLGRLTNLTTTVDTRLIAWKIAWQGFVERPFAGWGFDNFHILFNQKFNPESLRYGTYETWFDRSHNTVLDVLSMTGILGFFTFFAIYVCIFLATWKAYKQKWIDLPIAAILFSLPVAYFVQNLLVFDHPAGFTMSFMLYALIIAATKGEFVGEKDKAVVEAVKVEGHRDAPWILFTIIFVMFGLLVYRTSYLPFTASRTAIQANATFNVNPVLGYQLFKQASEIPTLYKDEQSFLMAQNVIGMLGAGVFQKVPNYMDVYGLAKSLSEEEVTRHPQNTHPHYIFARLAQEMMSVSSSEAQISFEEYQKAIATSPKRQQLWYGLARLYLQTGQLDKAVEVFKNVRDFDPEDGIGPWNYGLILMYDKAGQTNDSAIRLEGAQEIKKAMEVKWVYGLSSGRELLPLFDAYIVLQDTPGLTKWTEKLVDFPLADASTYAQIAMKMNIVQLNDLRDKILTIGENRAPGTKDAFEKMLNPLAPTPAAAVPSNEPNMFKAAATSTSGARR